MSADLQVGDHITIDGLGVHVISAKRVTPDSPSGVSFRLLPPVASDWVDAEGVHSVTGYSHRESGVAA